MIYNQSFIDYIEIKLGKIRKTTSNIIVPCPWCDLKKKNRSKNHLYISTEAPVFNCFRAGCNAKGTIKKLVTKLEGKDLSDSFINKDKLNELKKNKINTQYKNNKDVINFKIPEIRKGQFPSKELYVNKRLRFYIDIEEVKGLIFDVNKFLRINKVQITNKVRRIKDFLHSNFIGFISEHHNYVTFRNINSNSSFRFYKLRLQELPFLDYFKLEITNKISGTIILSEGIFDIYTEYLFDSLNLRSKAKLYGSIQSSNFVSLIKSIAFYEQLFRQDIVILADNGVDQNYFEKVKKFNSHIVNSINVCYNRTGKDFNSSVPIPERIKM